MDVNTKIQQIIANRANVASNVKQLSEKWNKRLIQAKDLKSQIQELRNVCTRAVTDAPISDQQFFQELLEYLDSLEKQQALQGNIGQASYALSKLSKLSERFNRKTINIAVAGVGRCGKSTALKAIIGQEQDDNSTIPSGSGTAVTAGKSTIACVATEAEEKTLVYYHSVSSFLDNVINPLLEDLGLGSERCANQSDFERLNCDDLRRKLYENQQAANQAVQDAERKNAVRTTETEQALAQAKAYASSFNQKIERLSHLEDIINSFPLFYNRLTGGFDSVPLKQTYRYVSYPKEGEGEPPICYAVKECSIFSRFPNNTIQSLQLVDLPGLGTGSLSERKCFMEGFNYSIDLALMIRRPEGLFQNFTTDDDLNVIEVIGATFGQDHLHECTILFQNDANLPQSDTEAAYKKIEKWNSGRKHPLHIIRGNAFDSHEMQNGILPSILQFMLRNLPAFDNSLLNESLPELEAMANKFDSCQTEMKNKLQSLKKNFRSGMGSANDVVERADKMRNEISDGLDKLREEYYNSKNFEEQDALLPEKIYELSGKLRKWAKETTYNHEDAKLVEDVRKKIARAEQHQGFASEEIQAIRIHISEVYSEMETIHVKLIEEMQGKIAKIFVENFKNLPRLADGSTSLKKISDIFEESGDCPEIVDALSSVLSLEIPFYTIVYPDIRKEVFDEKDDIKEHKIAVKTLLEEFKFDNSSSDEKVASSTLYVLQSIAINWIKRAETHLESPGNIKEILLATLRRLQDRLCRNDKTKKELNDFVEHFWSEIQGDNKSFSLDVHAKLEKITQLLNS